MSRFYEAEFSPLTKKVPDNDGKFALDTPVEAQCNGLSFVF
ncbi:hypothetical protein [Photobacterium leiognathi]|nr:hypothetical protein [Photobacterium leiognathi]